MIKNLFTTHEIAKFCSVDVSTIKNWINEGKLRAYKTPGGHRRINRKDLMQFLQDYGMPVPPQIKEEKIKVLIVDDNKDIVDIISRVLKKQKWGLKIEIAYDGYEAGVKVTSFHPDLMFLDIDLPGVDGYKILHNIKTNKSLAGIRIIAITGKNISETKERILSGGADIFLAKPLELDKLVSMVAKLLALPQRKTKK